MGLQPALSCLLLMHATPGLSGAWGTSWRPGARLCSPMCCHWQTTVVVGTGLGSWGASRRRSRCREADGMQGRALAGQHAAAPPPSQCLFSYVCRRLLAMQLPRPGLPGSPKHWQVLGGGTQTAGLGNSTGPTLDASSVCAYSPFVFFCAAIVMAPRQGFHLPCSAGDDREVLCPPCAQAFR